MSIKSFESLSEEIKRRAEIINFNLQESEETQYGFGWEPTLTFWNENRRVHFYFDSSFQEGINVEVAEIHPELKLLRRNVEKNSFIKKTTIKTTNEAWEIIDNFLRQKCDFNNLPAFSWTEETTAVDKFIPHPPNQDNPANIVSFVEKLKESGEVWQPEQVKKQPQWTKWLRNLLKGL